jgi:hypothetical protein
MLYAIFERSIHGAKEASKKIGVSVCDKLFICIYIRVKGHSCTNSIRYKSSTDFLMTYQAQGHLAVDARR